MSLILALMLAWTAIPARAQDAAPAPPDPLALVLTGYSVPIDAAAVAAPPSSPGENGERLAKVQADLIVVAVGFETLRAPEHADHARALAAQKISPELAPFFKDRDTVLDTVYRTMAVADYTWALRFPEPPCAPRDRRLALLKSRDGLFSDPTTGAPSPWLAGLLGPASYGRTAEDALDRASARAPLSAGDYERLRLRAAKISAALESPRAVAATRAKLYCERAEAYERLAQAHRAAGGGAVLAGRSSGGPAKESASVLLLAMPDGKGYRALGAAFLVETGSGVKVVTDSSLFTDAKGLVVFLRPATGGTLGEPYALTIERYTPGSGPALGHLNKDPGAPALKLSVSPVALGDLMTGLGHLRAGGSWSFTQGLVTATGDGTYQTDALLSPEMAGSPMLNESGEVVGLVLGHGDQAVVLQPAKLKEFLDGGAPRVDDWKAPSNAGSAVFLTALRPRDLDGMTAPGGAAIETGLPSQLGGVNWEGGGGLGNFRPQSVPSPSFSYSAPSSFHPSDTGDLSLPSSPSSSGSQFTGCSPDSPFGLLLRATFWVALEPFHLLGQGVEKLSEPGPKTVHHPAPAKVKPAPKPVPPPPPPPPPVPKITGLTLTASPANAVPGERVTLIAQFKFEGDYKDKSGISVDFDATGQMAYFGEPGHKALSSQTDAGGRATAVLTLEEDLAVSAREQFDDLERETHRHDGGAAPSAPRVSAGDNATPTRKVADAAASAMDALDAEESSNEEQQTRLDQPTESALVIPGGPPVAPGAIPGIVVNGAGGGFDGKVTIGPRVIQSPLQPPDCVDQLKKLHSQQLNARQRRQVSYGMLQDTLRKYALSYEKFREDFGVLIKPSGPACIVDSECRLKANREDWDKVRAAYGEVQALDMEIGIRESALSKIKQVCEAGPGDDKDDWSDENKKSSRTGNSDGATTAEFEGEGARSSLKKPSATNPRLQRVIDALFKPQDKTPGGTAGAIREERITGMPTQNKFHFKKGLERSIQLRKILRQEPLSSVDRATAEAMLDDLRNAMDGK